MSVLAEPRLCAWRKCGRSFTPARSDARFCHPNCRYYDWRASLNVKRRRARDRRARMRDYYRTPGVWEAVDMRFPVADLARYQRLTLLDLERVLGIGRDHQQVKADGEVSYIVAERWCERLGVHPSEVWPVWFDVIPPRCLHCWKPLDRTARYCSPKCKSAAKALRSPNPKRRELAMATLDPGSTG